jgi:hypothetical protein
MEPTAGDGGKIKIPRVSVLAGVMGGLSKDNADKATSSLANMQLNEKDVKTGWVSQEAYNQIKATL